MLINRLRKIIKSDFEERCSIFNLNASENHMSAEAKAIAASHPAYDCYEFPPSGGNITGPWKFDDHPYNEQVTDFIAEQCFHFLGSRRVDVRARSGQTAEIAVLLGLAKAGDHVFYVDEKSGGHFGLTEMAKKTAINLHPLIFDFSTHQIDIDQTLTHLNQYWRTSSTKLIVINQSFILQQQNWSLVVDTLKSYYPDLIISCDVSHLLGLIVGQQIDNPLLYGVDIIHASTHKTFPGPQKAIIVFNPAFDQEKELFVRQAVSPLLQSSSGTAEIMALAHVLCEMKDYGKIYASEICKNAKILANTLAHLKFNVVGRQFGFTQTHQCWLPIGTEVAAWEASGLLHASGLRNLPAFLPFVNTWGIRFGVNALTRRGLQQEHFVQIAYWIRDVLVLKKSAVKVKKQILQLSCQFPLTNLKYVLREIKEREHVI